MNPKLIQMVWLFFVLSVCTIQAKANNPSNIKQIPSGIVKIIATHSHADYQSPWQRRAVHVVTGSGAIIKGNWILTNAHIVEDQTLLEVKRQGISRPVTASVEYVCHTCDLALLKVQDKEFMTKVTPLELGDLPELQSRVNVYGFPKGGETISITEGIVSRIEVDYYVHSSDRFVLAQVDAAINPGNSGGPVISDGKIIGIAMQALENAENIGYIVPTPIIKHFIKDVKDGKFDGFPELDVYGQLLENTALRQQLDIQEYQGGIMVVGVGKRSSAFKHLKAGDVILELDGLPIERDGKVTLKNGLRLESTHLEYIKQVGETVDVRLLRNGKITNKKIKMEVRKRLIPNRNYDNTPNYFIYSGLVFQTLSRGFIKSLRNSFYGLAPHFPEYSMAGYVTLKKNRIVSDRKEVVVLSQILPDELNRGYKGLKRSVIHSVNGEEIKDLKHFVELVENFRGRFLKILTDLGSVITLDAKKARARNKDILSLYRIHEDRSPNLK